MVRLLIVLLLFPCSVFANTLTLDFKEMQIQAVCNTVFKGILRKSFVLSDDVQQSQQKITIYAKDIDSSLVVPIVKQSLASASFTIELKDDVYYITKSLNDVLTPTYKPISQHKMDSPDPFSASPVPPVSQDSLYSTYKPKYRSNIYLANIIKFMGANVSESVTADLIIFSSTKQSVLDAIDKRIIEFDTKQQSVKIRAVLLEFTDGADSSQSFTTAITAINKKLGIAYSVGKAAAGAVSFSTAGLSVLLSAIDSDSRFQYLAQPSLTLLNGEESKMQIGSEVPTLSSTSFDVKGNAIQSITYRSSGVILSVKPYINGDSIILTINQELSNFTQTTTSDINSPTLLKRSIQTTVDSKVGEVVALGGLDESKDSVSTSGLFFLPDFMKSKTKTKTKSQIVLLFELLPA
jgi:general secretion pathway protein D